MGKYLIIPTSHYSFHRNFSVDPTLCFAVLGRQYKQCFYGICLVHNFWQGLGLILTQKYIPLTSIYCCCAVVPFISTKNSDLYITGEWQDIGFHMCIWMQVKTDNMFLVHCFHSHEPFIFHLKNTYLILNFIKYFIIKM